jgi:hypothetical protein
MAAIGVVGWVEVTDSLGNSVYLKGNVGDRLSSNDLKIAYARAMGILKSEAEQNKIISNVSVRAINGRRDSEGVREDIVFIDGIVKVSVVVNQKGLSHRASIWEIPEELLKKEEGKEQEGVDLEPADDFVEGEGEVLES